ncbi:hypothetical protein SEA_NICHOLAS_65 [Mycobacterium phage Nicholas]|uniref:Uncharacterized protein n=1 Tax=Mycobacterium phage Lumos TaxID=1701852 RepID=A0A0K2CMI6_9CAUD|nr:hypothetical protein AVU96_gp114 [Mycobacterium phage Snenia]YP_010012525.1 hypothetical protein J4T93_gp111 [Mycobacterium phage Lumos]ASM62803.1 hypothetical protein SEA_CLAUTASTROPHE_66 [Mycobacterium phage Clautastrophe]ASR86993.1 hypothetical protein SEA_KINGSOLOMON_65 [Mycobacterium phage Kingsolomon]ASR87336.1 hypothetical protein SEA_NICHOLAS_65 [Mycobacterium phage Nicholas]AYB70420.1 hypothetical protein SEA_SAMTY_67 [Mycobacterium phage Samty]QDF16650.1 hypothetical protein PBI_
MSITLDEARDDLHDKMGEGAECPCCGQFAKVYRVKFPATAVKLMAEMLKQHRAGVQWVHAPTAGPPGGNPVKARHWGLIEPMPDAVREDGSKRVGLWRLTTKGYGFIRNMVAVPKYALLFNNDCLALDDSEGNVTAAEAAGHKFNYRELMAGV